MAFLNRALLLSFEGLKLVSSRQGLFVAPMVSSNSIIINR